MYSLLVLAVATPKSAVHTLLEQGMLHSLTSFLFDVYFPEHLLLERGIHTCIAFEVYFSVHTLLERENNGPSLSFTVCTDRQTVSPHTRDKTRKYSKSP